MPERIAVVGAGPAGAGAAAGIAKAGYKPVVYEAMDRPGVKPCGRGVPVVGDLPIEIPREAIVRRIRSAVMYVNGDFLFKLEDVFTGYIVDKGVMIEAMIASVGGEIVYKARFHPETGRIGGPNGEKLERGVFAGGHPYYEGPKILALQYIMETHDYDDTEELEIYFDTELMGYYYIFPGRSGTVEVGVGGFADIAELRRRLDKFVRERENLRDKRTLKVEGARIAIGGLRLGWVGGLPKAGEAAGFVMPLTGEGIRPSMISGFQAGLAVSLGKDPLKSQEETKIASAIKLQSRVLEAVMKLTPEERAEVLRSLSPRMHAELSLGRATYSSLARELAGKPSVFLKLLRALR